MDKNLLFLHGECIKEDFLSRFPGLPPDSQPYTLTGYAAENTASGRSFLRPCPESQVNGLLIFADDDLLWAMDQWKQLPLLRREELPGPKAGQSLSVYLANAAPDTALAPEPSAELENFLRLYQENELGKCDVHLMFPCSFEAFQPPRSPSRDVLGEGFVRQLYQVNREEFAGSYLRLERGCIGIFSFGVDFPGSEGKHIQTGFVHYSLHKATQIGTLSILFPSTAVSALQILNVFCSNALTLFQSGVYTPFLSWLQKEYGLFVYGSPRAVLFAYNSLAKEQLMGCLAMERHPMSELVGSTLTSYAADNFAQYNLAEVYASSKCLIEIEKECCLKLENRLAMEALEIFFVELLQMQSASVRRVCSRVLDYLNSSEVLEGVKNYQKLITLSSEMSAAILFFDYDYFLYPTVSIACRKISQRFGMEEEMEKYYKYREILEQMINLAQEQREKIENDNMNLLLLILTLVQVLPTFVETCQMTLEGTWSGTILLSWCLSIAFCAVLCGVFRRYKKNKVRQVSRSQKRSI